MKPGARPDIVCYFEKVMIYHTEPFDCRLEAERTRRVAQVYYDARNLYFNQAASAYRSGMLYSCSHVPHTLYRVMQRSIHMFFLLNCLCINSFILLLARSGDGRLAAELSRRGKEMGELAKHHRIMSNDAVGIICSEMRSFKAVIP